MILSLAAPHTLAQTMANFVQKLVSKKKRRFQEDGFDLDMTCELACALAHSLPPPFCLPPAHHAFSHHQERRRHGLSVREA